MAQFMWNWCPVLHKIRRIFLVFVIVFILGLELRGLSKSAVIAIETRKSYSLDLNSTMSTSSRPRPRLHVMVSDRPGVVGGLFEIQNDEPLVLLKFPLYFIVVCSAPYPIEWKPSSIMLQDFEVPDSDFSIDLDKTLGSGEFGVVYAGKLRGEDVAIKTTKSTADVDFFEAFLREIKVMTFLGQHSNVVQLLGTSTSRVRERVVFVLVELGVHGCLNSFLMKNKSNFVDTLSSSQLFNIASEKLTSTGYANITSAVTITTLDMVKWCGQIAAGTTHLASKKIIHGDLAPRNILLFADYTAKITDFGLSRQLYTSTNYTKTNKSPLPWRLLAPESLKYLQFSVKSDVWAFGVLAWEVFSLAAVPYCGLSWTQDFVDELEQGLRLQKPKWASNEMYKNMCDCWYPQAENRPDFEQLETFYNDFLGTVGGSGYENEPGVVIN